jgi:hypothetical protein
MRKTRKFNRRSFLASVAGGAVAGSMLTISGEAKAQGCSDSDPGDPLGHGRRCTGGGTTRSGCSDRDSGNGADPGGHGRNCVASGCSDNDPTDPGGSGRNCGGNQRAGGSDIRGRCTYQGCSCTSYVQPDTGWTCQREGCGHHYNWHENPDA